MAKNIELSPKYGVNPFIPNCFWCGKPSKVVVMAGRIRVNPETGEKEINGDFEAKNGMFLDYTPCEDCKNHWNMGVAMIEALPNLGDNRPPIGKDNKGNDVSPTGRWTVISADSEFAKVNGFKKGQIALIDKNMMDELVPLMEQKLEDLKNNKNNKE